MLLATFQKAMNIIFADTPNILAFMDDIIVFPENFDYHLKHVEIELIISKSSLMKLTEFCKWELLFMGGYHQWMRYQAESR